MAEIAMSFVHIRQEFQGEGARFEQLRTHVHTHLLSRMDELQTELENTGVRVAQATQEHEHNISQMTWAAKLQELLMRRMI